MITPYWGNLFVLVILTIVLPSFAIFIGWLTYHLALWIIRYKVLAAGVGGAVGYLVVGYVLGSAIQAINANWLPYPGAWNWAWVTAGFLAGMLIKSLLNGYARHSD